MQRVAQIARIGTLGWLLAAGAAGAAETCVDSPTQICAGGGRYRLSASYLNPGAPGAPIAAGGRLLPAGAPTQFAAVFWFGEARTIDLRVGVVERCGSSAQPPSPGVDVTVAATTQNAFTVRVEDLETSTQRTLTRKVGAARGSLRAEAAFPCAEPAN